jgi:hypothetical protein
MKALILISIFSMSFTFAKSLMIAPETETSSGCDLEVAGFNEKESFLKFFPLLKEAVKTKDPKKISPFMLYPFKVNGKTTIKIKNAQEFEAKFKTLITEKIIVVISNQKIEDLFCQYQGVMFGDGEVWVQKINGKVGISAINP